ncbi:MAG: hypothetical protein RBQ97_07845 [Acholeplasma sp.]|nr:hypothetical protein [Acholeplasma sp.]
MKKNFLFKNRKGAALAWMLIAFTLLMILMSSIIYITRQDILETNKQKERLQAYYIALAGVDLTYSALMDTDYSPKYIDIAITNLKADSTPITDDIDVTIDGDEKGTATVSLDRVTVNEKDWLRITSVGKLKGFNTTASSTMRINELNHNQIVRER